MDDRHKRFRHAGRVFVLDDIPPVDDAGDALLHQILCASEHLCIISFATPSDQNRDSGSFDDTTIVGNDVSRIGFDDVCAQFGGLAHEGHDLVRVSVHHVAARLPVGSKDQGLNHQRHLPAVALWLDTEDVLDALVGDLGFVRDLEEVDDDADGIES